jgi:hypothetical protein
MLAKFISRKQKQRFLAVLVAQPRVHREKRPPSGAAKAGRFRGFTQHEAVQTLRSMEW